MSARVHAAVLFACTALLPATASAQANPPVYDWSGFYIGGTGGFSSADFDVSNILFEGFDAGIGTFSLSPDGVILGGTGGFNAQFGSFVAGIEGDISWTSLEASHTDTTFGFEGTGELEWLATVRGRVGFAVDRFLIFGTGGAAFGSVKATIDDFYPAGTRTTSDSHVHLGWAAGGGGEFAVTDHISVKGEGLFYDLGSEGYSFYEGGPPGWNPITIDVEASGWLARLGVNIRY